MLHISTVLKYYKRKEIQEAIVSAADSREVAVSYGGKGYGKRPDTLKYPSDVIELAKSGATSFHCSEEIWTNPLQLETGMKKSDLNSIRKGWDLVLDIDCPDWQISKTIAHLIVKSLREHGIRSVSAKFSGNKGFHIGLPFSSMPKEIRGESSKSTFPDSPRKIAAYLMDYIAKRHTRVIGNSSVSFGEKLEMPIKKIAESTGKSLSEITKKICSECGKQIKSEAESRVHFICGKCGRSEDGESSDSIRKCLNCGAIMEKIGSGKSLCSCGSNSYTVEFEPKSVVEVDTILIAPRHLYRMPYSLHEKSGLASVPVEPDSIVDFEKESANPENVVPGKEKFLFSAPDSEGEAEELVLKALGFSDSPQKIGNENGNRTGNMEEIHFEKAVPKELFPPCIQIMLKGIEDGKKRSVFVLLNFLTSLGWDYEKIDELMHDWNKKNPEPLRETVLVSQLRYHRQGRKRVLPPNCDNMNYYKGIGICRPDNLCSRIKNPVSYCIRKVRYSKKKQ